MVAVGLAAFFDDVVNQLGRRRNRRLLVPLPVFLVPFERVRLALESGRQPVERFERRLLLFFVRSEARLGLEHSEPGIAALRRRVPRRHLVGDHLPLGVHELVQVVLHDVLVIAVAFFVSGVRLCRRPGPGCSRSAQIGASSEGPALCLVRPGSIVRDPRGGNRTKGRGTDEALRAKDKLLQETKKLLYRPDQRGLSHSTCHATENV